MKITVLYCLLLLSFKVFAQKPLIYKGKIGTYPIEVQFTKCDTISGKFEGRYRYAKKEKLPDLKWTVEFFNNGNG